MSIQTIYDRRDVLGNSYPGFDNSPDYQNSAWGKLLDGIAQGSVISSGFSYGRIAGVSGTVTTQTVDTSYNGNTYRVVMVGNSDYDYKESISVSGRMISSWTDIELSVSDRDFYSGAQLYEIIYKKNDTITGSNMPDNIWGYEGLDALWGNGGDDILVGGASRDTLQGGDGDDTLIGGTAHVSGVSTYSHWAGDVYRGGSGNDTIPTNFAFDDMLLSKNPSSQIITWMDFDGSNMGTIHPDVEEIRFTDNGSFIYIDLKEMDGYFGELSTFGSAYFDQPVFRFYNNRDKAFFYTSSKEERDFIINNSAWNSSLNDDPSGWPYIYQGASFATAHSYLSSDTLVPLHRFYNSETGHHFFTASESEANLVKEKAGSGEWPFNYEGTAFNVYQYDPNPSAAGDELAVHRFYSPSLNRHFFTGDPTEVSNMQLTGIWNYEGIGFWGEIL